MPRRKRKSRAHVMRAFLNFIAWLTGMLISLSVGFAMASGNLFLPIWLGGIMASMIVGWIIIILTLIGVIIAIFSK